MSTQPIFTRTQYDSALRESFYAFLIAAFNVLHGNRQFRRARHVEAMCLALERVARGDTKRLIITVPPRHLKSITVAVAFVAWMLGHDPSQKVLVASYGGDLAAKHARDFRRVSEDPVFRRCFPGYVASPMRDTMLEVETTLNGGRKGVSVGGAVTGFGASRLIVDDLMKAGDAYSEAARTQVKNYFDETLCSRFDDPAEASIVVIQQRLHEDDLVGHLLDKGGWQHIDLPAIAEEPQELELYAGRVWRREIGDLLAPELMSRADLDEKRREMGIRGFEAQYQQNPVPPNGDRVRWEWFKEYSEPLQRGEYQAVVQSWDTATSEEPGSDFSVCMTFGFDQGTWDLLDVYRRRLNYPGLRRAAMRLYEQWRPDRVLVEDASSGRQLVQDMLEAARTGRRTFLPIRPLTNKEERLDLQTGKLEDELISLPERAAWLAEFKRELLGFPGTRHDDQVDALTQFLQWTDDRRWAATLNRDPTTGRRRSGPRQRGQEFGAP